MRHAQVIKAGIGLGLALLVACASDSNSAFDGASPKASASCPGPTCGDDGDAAASPADNGTKTPGTSVRGGPTSDGVLIVHTAAFPSFRLCFEGLPDLVPQPDASVMPEANVVGVEMGSIVRIEPLKTRPGRVFVVRERDLRAISAPGDVNAKTCGEIFPKKDDGSDDAPLVERGSAFFEAGTLENPVGVESPELLAIYGCGSQTTLTNLDFPAGGGTGNSSGCGSTWKPVDGNLTAKTIPLPTSYATPTKKEIPIQLYNVAPAIEALNGTIAVTFGEPGKETLPLTIGPLFARGEQIQLDVDQDDVASYGSRGFKVDVTLPPSDSVIASQTLADVQALSSPNTTPSIYYQTASNYALLLLGDPTHKAKLPGGGDNPQYNPRRALHILAVPVLDPTKIDAGAPDGGTETSEAGTQ